MKNAKKYEVAVILDEKGKEIGCFKCKLVEETEYYELNKKTKETRKEFNDFIDELRNRITELNEKIVSLENEVKILKGEE